MIRPAPEERVVARRPHGPKPLLLGIALTGAVAMVLYAVATRVLSGAVHLEGLMVFLLTFTAINAAAQLMIRRRIDYCLTDRRLILGPDREIPLDQIAGFDVGPHSLTVRTGEHRYRIVALSRPAWLATRLNRCRASVCPDTGEVAA